MFSLYPNTFCNIMHVYCQVLGLWKHVLMYCGVLWTSNQMCKGYSLDQMCDGIVRIFAVERAVGKGAGPWCKILFWRRAFMHLGFCSRGSWRKTELGMSTVGWSFASGAQASVLIVTEWSQWCWEVGSAQVWRRWLLYCNLLAPRLDRIAMKHGKNK